MSGSDLYNIYQGKHDAWQLGETIDDFLQRLPPHFTPATFSPWIWVANPHPSGRDRSARAHVSSQLISRGQLLLQESLAKRDEICKGNSSATKAQVNRMLHQESESLKQRITQLAEDANVLSGKVRLSVSWIFTMR
jgi:hypothetical protein